MSDFDLDEMERCARAATPGPWAVEYAEIGPYGSPDLKLVAFVKTEGEDGEYIVVDEEPDAVTDEPSPDAVHIAKSNPDVILALIAACRALVDAVDASLDDMGVSGKSVCGLAKAMLRLALEPFLSADREAPDYTLKDAVCAIIECDEMHGKRSRLREFYAGLLKGGADG